VAQNFWATTLTPPQVPCDGMCLQSKHALFPNFHQNLSNIYAVRLSSYIDKGNNPILPSKFKSFVNFPCTTSGRISFVGLDKQIDLQLALACCQKENLFERHRQKNIKCSLLTTDIVYGLELCS